VEAPRLPYPCVMTDVVGEIEVEEALTDPDRLGELARTGLLDSAPEEAFDRLTRLASRVLETPAALVSLVDDRREFFKSAAGISEDDRERPLSHSYCKYVVATGEPLVAADAREHDLLKDNPAIEDYNAIAYCGIPVRSHSGHVLGSFCVVDEKPRQWSREQIETLSDLTDSVVSEVQLRLLAHELAETNQALRDFIATASHDMRTPLTSILGFSQLLRDSEHRFSPEQRREFVTVIGGQAERLDRLVGDLLSAAALEAGSVSPRITRIAVPDAFESALQPFSGRADDLVVEAAPLSVWADADHLDRVLVNLIGNALKYGEPPVHLGAAEAGPFVRLSVRDHGPGVDADFADQLFQRFARSRSARAGAATGTGLGLFIVRGLVEANGGMIRHEPADPGAAFVVELPKATYLPSAASSGP
jgi:signal transduction histidine kinase